MLPVGAEGEPVLVYSPRPLPPDPPVDMDQPLQVLLSGADQALGRLDGAIRILPDADLFSLMYVRREAVLSSQIEGTQSTLDDVLRAEAAVTDPRRPDDVAEVLNYIGALQEGTRALGNGLRVSDALVRQLHRRLLPSARWGTLPAGEWRCELVWIGAPGSSIQNATFVPPPADDVPSCLSDLFGFLDGEDELPVLVKVGLAHAQFETIHPFFDGNGRIGRQLITLLLMQYGVLSRPVLYLSHYMKAYRAEYYRRLQEVRDQGGWEGWLAFFLAGVASVAREATDTAAKIVDLREEMRSRLLELGRPSVNALRLHERLFATPIMGVEHVAEFLGLGYQPANRLVERMVDVGVLEEITGGRRNRRFAYSRYIALFSDE